MNRIWKKKSDDKPLKESNSSPSVENPSPVKGVVYTTWGELIVRSLEEPLDEVR